MPTETDDWGDPVQRTTHDLEKEPLIGIYRGYKMIDAGDYGPSKLHEFETDAGPASLWGKTHINGLLEHREGELVKVVLTGNTIPIKGRSDMIEYAVYSKGRPNTPPKFPGEPD